MSVRSLFSEEELARIRGAVAEVETGTSGEIVPYLVGRVDDHDEARWRGATLGALLVALAAGVVHQIGGIWGGYGIFWITLPAVTGAGLGFLLSAIPAVGRRLLTPDDLERRVRLRAEAAFLDEEVFRTRDRTGILLFVAFFERRALVLADEGIHRAVPKEVWVGLVDELVEGISSGRPTDAICSAIARCGELLGRYGVAARPDDTDELADGLRLRET